MLRSPNPPPEKIEDVRAALSAAGAETFRIPEGSPVLEKNLGDLDLRGKTGAMIIAVVRDGETKISPGANYKLKANDPAVLLGSAESIEKAFKLLFPNEP